MPPISKAFELISLATVAKSAAEAKRLLYLRPDDGITMNRDRLLADAKARALALVEGYRPPDPPAEIRLPGPTAKVALDLAVHAFATLGKATAHDRVVAGALAEVLSGGGEADITRPLTEDDLLALERRVVHAADPPSRQHRPDRAHARDRQAVAQLMYGYRAPLRDMRFVLHELLAGEPVSRAARLRGRHARADRQRAGAGGEAGRERAGAAQPHRRRGGLQLRERRRAHAARLQGGLCHLPRRRLDRRRCRRRSGAARACRGCSTSRSRRCSPAPTSPSPSIPA